MWGSEESCHEGRHKARLYSSSGAGAGLVSNGALSRCHTHKRGVAAASSVACGAGLSSVLGMLCGLAMLPHERASGMLYCSQGQYQPARELLDEAFQSCQVWHSVIVPLSWLGLKVVSLPPFPSPSSG